MVKIVSKHLFLSFSKKAEKVSNRWWKCYCKSGVCFLKKNMMLFFAFLLFFFWRDSWSDKKLKRQHRTAVFRKKKTTNLTFYLNSWKQQYLTPKQSSRIRLSQRAGEWRRPHGVNGDNIILIFIFAFKEDNSASFFYEFLLPVILHFTYFIITHFIYYSSSFITVFSLNLKSFQTSLSNLQLQPLL